MSEKRGGVCEMIKNISMIVFGIVLVSLNSGCIYSYYELDVPGCAAELNQRVAVIADDGGRMANLSALYTYTWRRTLFYPRYFSYFHLREGSPVLLLEAVCRLPTVLLEVPFNSINRGERGVELCLPVVGPTSVAGAAMPVMLSKDEVVALKSKNEKLDDFARQAWSEVGYRLGDSIYMIDLYVSQEKINLFGVAFSSPEPVVWRIDPITGDRWVLVSFDAGKFIIENPPRKVKSRYVR